MEGEINQNCGIYKLTCRSKKGFDYIYIGQSIHLDTRWYEHRRDMKGGYHSNAKIQRVYNKYGLDNFQFQIIEFCNSDCLDEIEIHYIKTYNTYKSDHGLNLTPGGKNYLKGTTQSEEIKRKKSETLKKTARRGKDHMWYGRILTSEDREKVRQRFVKSIQLIDPSGNLIEVNGIQKFCRDNNLTMRSIFSLRKGDIQNHRGYRSFDEKLIGVPCESKDEEIWNLVDSAGNYIKVDNLTQFCKEKGILKSVFHELKRGRNKWSRGYRYCFEALDGFFGPFLPEQRGKTIVVILPDGKRQEITGVDKFCQENNLLVWKFRDLRKGKIESYNGFRVENPETIVLPKFNQNKIWTLISPSGGFVTITDLPKFCEENGFSKGCFSSMRKGKVSHCYGYRYFHEPTQESPWKSEDFSENPYSNFIYIRNPLGAISQFSDLKRACDEYDLKLGPMQRLKRGVQYRYHHKGYTFATDSEYIQQLHKI